ncbi:MAG: PEP-CTERM sorting domain-containing protein [Planctomycetes bacterium]|nr:PEP-CTERM sorting domain-containing protein [Planctomycetota bacterium]
MLSFALAFVLSLSCALVEPQDPGAVRGAPSANPPATPQPGSREAASAVPEPTTLFLVGAGLIGLAVSSRRWRKAIAASKN